MAFCDYVSLILSSCLQMYIRDTSGFMQSSISAIAVKFNFNLGKCDCSKI